MDPGTAKWVDEPTPSTVWFRKGEIVMVKGVPFKVITQIEIDGRASLIIQGVPESEMPTPAKASRPPVNRHAKRAAAAKRRKGRRG